MIVGEAEEKKGKPFQGAAGGMLNAFLSSSGIARHECYITNVFNFMPLQGKVRNICGGKADGIPSYPALEMSKYVRKEYAPELARLWREVEAVNPNIIVACGTVACWALLKDRRIKKLRGAPSLTHTGHKVFPTYSPSQIMRQYKLRPIAFADFNKIAREALFPDIRRPKRTFWLEPTYADLLLFEKHILAAKVLSVDIETWNKQITCIGFAPSEDRAIVIPFVWHGTKDGNYWPTLEEELKVWALIRRWLALSQGKIGQNFLYDTRYIWEAYGIPINNIEGDTMLIHHAMQPEMEKSLGFLGSIYTDEPNWKFMRKDIKTLKKED